MLELDAGGQESQFSIDGQEKWSILNAGKLIITSEYLKFGDIEINHGDIKEAVYNQCSWPYKLDTLILHTEHGKYLFNFERLAIDDFSFPFEVIRIKVNPFQGLMSKFWMLILLILLLRFLLDIWQGYAGS